MVILLLIGITLVGVSIIFTIRALAYERFRRQETLAQIGSYGFSGSAPVAAERRSLRDLVRALADCIGRVALRRLKPEGQRKLQALLRGAGHYGMRPETFLGYRILATMTLPLLWVWFAIVSGSIGPRVLLGLVMVGALVWVLPSFHLKRRATLRTQQIDREMPEFVDLLVTTVEAGVGFAASMQLVARRVEGPLADELRITLQEQTMGLTIEEALENMLGRLESASVRAFVQAIVQGQTLGVSIGKILRDLALDMRKRRRQMAEERAQKAPTKILFPLVVLLLPALFIVALGGPMISLMDSLNSM